MKNRCLLFLILVTMLPLGSFGTLSHDSAGRLEWETAASDSCTAVIRYTYDAAGRLSKTEKGLRKGDSGTEISSSSVTRDYTYDVHGWKVKIVTGIPMKLARGAAETTDISTPYYGAASSDVIKTPGGVVVARTNYTETIHYADGAVPRYNGTPSARDLTQGGRYDYRYDTLDRLIAADYTPPSGKPDTDFSTEYTYDILSRPTSIKRHGVVDVDGADEVFGLLDNLTLTYDGATLGAVKSIITDETGRDYYGRTGFAKGTYMASAPVEYNAAGRLVKDTGRMLSLVRYNTMGLPVLYSMSTDMTGNPPRQERSYDATGIKRRQTDYGAVRGQIAKTADRRYMESFTFNADTLERIEFNGGYFDRHGKAHFLFTDWQGNVTMTTDAGGRLEQHIGYYPYGEPWREPAGQHAKLFAGKERVTGLPGGDYDFGPRGYRATTTLWDSWDIHAADYAMWSPWMYCGGNPIRFVDPSGMQFTEKSEDYVESLIEDINKRKRNNNSKIDNIAAEIAKGGLSDKKIEKLNNEISKLNANNSALDNVLSEIETLRNSSQMYNIVYDTSLNLPGDRYGNGPQTNSYTGYNDKTDIVDILLGDNHPGSLAHELKHAYQFETGAISFGKIDNGIPFCDKSDEREAYERQELFGKHAPNNLPSTYKNYPEGPNSVDNYIIDIRNNPVASQRVANSNRCIFRWQGVTYKSNKL